ncbi:MAG: transporter associated domain-containing protein, partial [Myxococcaceae bacterium]
QGGMAGLVTMEDLVEELVGDIFSEHEQALPDAFQREPDGSAVVAATMAIRDVNRELCLDLPEEGDWTSLGGLCLMLSGHIPVVGEKIVTPNGVVLEVVDASARRVRTVRIRSPSQAGE